MIEITHPHAQRMIREGQDRPLPDEQWAMLQAHLERCPDCRAYQARLAGYDRDLRRALRIRWGGARGPAGKMRAWVIQYRQQRKQRARTWGRALLGLLAVALFGVYLGYRQMTAPPPPPPKPTAAVVANLAAQAPTQRAAPKITFPGLLALETRRDGNAEIYLAAPTPEGVTYTNLTQDPAEDTSPAWSPDGDWIAFLSNRTGKNEVYVIHVAGSRLTQITASPEIFWEGPLTWSADGQTIALIGRRGSASGAAWAYLARLNGEATESLASSYGAHPGLLFSSAQPALALAGYEPQTRLAGLRVIHSEGGWNGLVTLGDSQSYNLETIMNGGFDWSLGGRNLVYVADQPALSGLRGQSELHLSEDLEVFSHQYFTGAGSQSIDRVPFPQHFRAVSWVPHSLMVASLVGSEQEDCWTVRLSNAYSREQPPRSLSGLCVVGGLRPANWMPDGSWLVLIARRPEEQDPALYALRLPASVDRAGATRGLTLAADQRYFERLDDLAQEPLLPGGTYPAWAEPRVRPTGRYLNIEPQAARAAGQDLRYGAGPAPALPPAGDQGWIVYAAAVGRNSQIVRIRPDGSQRQALTGADQENTCPRYSPDGKTIAYTSSPDPQRPTANEVYRMDADGKNAVPLTHTAASATGNIFNAVLVPRYRCPVWSPDGQRLAVVVEMNYLTYLAILSADGSPLPQYLMIDGASAYSDPVWVPKDPHHPERGADRIFFVRPIAQAQAELVSVTVPGAAQGQAPATAQPAAGEGPAVGATPPAPERTPTPIIVQPANLKVLLPLPNWDDAGSLALSPDGRRLAMKLVYLHNISAISLSNITRIDTNRAQLRVVTMDTFDAVYTQDFPTFEAITVGMGSLAWTTGGQVEQMRVSSLVGSAKTIIERFSLDGDGPKSATWVNLLEDVATRAVWQGERWIALSAESGLWVVDTQPPAAAEPGVAAATFLVSGEPILDLDWK